MVSADSCIRIAINADVVAGNGGVFQATQALVSALGQLEGPERYLLLARSQEQVGWLEKCRGPNQEISFRGKQSRWGQIVHYQSLNNLGPCSQRIKAAIRPTIEGVRQFLGRLTPQSPRLPLSDGFVESLGCDVLHFPTQAFVVSAVPTVFNPHDLQHLHYPQFWTPWEVARRELVYRTGCALAAAVVVGSQWAKGDILRQYGVDPEKVQVIPEGAPGGLRAVPTDEEVREVKKRHQLPDLYALYPANMWPHKNHLKLLDSMALLRNDAGLLVSLVCTGSKEGGAWPRVQARISALGLERQVQCLGYVPEVDIRVIQRAAHCLVQPSLFEASSLPIFDAWMDGVPVGASRVTALPEQAGDAALLFDPFNACSIADVLGKLWSRTDIRESLRLCGYRRIGHFDWTRTAKAYRAIYRRVARVTLNDEDRYLLKWNWMAEPRTRDKSVIPTPS